MSDVREMWSDIMDTCESAAEQGMCTCKALHHVSDNEGFTDVVTEMLSIGAGILNFSEPSEIEGNLGHFLTAVIALGYALGASDAYDITLLSDICVPDSLAALDFVENLDRDRHESE